MATLSRPARFAATLAVLVIGLTTASAQPRQVGWDHPATVVVILDRSVPAYRLKLAKDAARELVAALEPGDRLGFIAAGGDLLTQSGSRVLNENGRRRLLAWLDETQTSDGSAELGLGPTLEMAESLLGLTQGGARSAHLLLFSDGAHVPGARSNAELQRQMTALTARGVRVDAVSPGPPQTRPPLEALAELGGGRLLVLKGKENVRALLAP